MTERVDNQAIVFIFLDHYNNQVLMEQRLKNSAYADQLIFPGGAVEENETNDLEVALRREIQEELGVEVSSFYPLKLSQTLYSPTGKLLIPYVITQWQGELPKVVLDKGNPLIWQDIEEATKSPIEKVRFIAEALIAHLGSFHDSS